MLDIKLVKTLDVNNTLGEGVIWDARTQLLWWTDIQSSCLYSWSFEDELIRYRLPERLGSFGLTTVPGNLICGFESGFALYNPKQQSIKWINKIEQNQPNTRLNDGRVDRRGRFWAGSMNEDNEDRIASLYRLSDESAQPVLPDIQISNGLCWNKTGDRMYFADSPSRCIRKFAFDGEQGQVSDEQVFVRTERGAYPDGACVDAQDNLWSAQWGSGKVRCYSPDGIQLTEISVPCPQPSCITFGGPDMQHIFVTSAREGLTNQQLAQSPQSGNLFIFTSNMRGLPESICSFDPKRRSG